MEVERQALEIEGLVFASTSDGSPGTEDVRRHVSDLKGRIAALEAENSELRQRLEHLASLRRLAEATVVKADELAAEIEADARARAEELRATCDRELAERRREFEAEQAAELAAARWRVEQLQVALEGSVQTLARAMSAVSSPALEMPPARNALPPPEVFTPAVEPDPYAPLGGGEPSPYASPGGEPPPPWGEAAIADPWGAGEILGPSAREVPAAQAEAVPSADDGPAELEDRSSATFYANSEAPFELEPTAGRSDRSDRTPPRDLPAGSDAAESGTAEPAPSVNGALAAWPADGEAESGGSLAQPAELDGTEKSPSDVPATVPADPGREAAAVARRGPETIEIDMRPVKSFADLARVTKLLGGIAPGAQPVDLNLPQHRALFSVRGRDREALATQLAEALPEANVVQRENGIDVLLGDDER